MTRTAAHLQRPLAHLLNENILTHCGRCNPLVGTHNEGGYFRDELAAETTDHQG